MIAPSDLIAFRTSSWISGSGFPKSLSSCCAAELERALPSFCTACVRTFGGRNLIRATSPKNAFITRSPIGPNVRLARRCQVRKPQPICENLRQPRTNSLQDVEPSPAPQRCQHHWTIRPGFIILCRSSHFFATFQHCKRSNSRPDRQKTCSKSGRWTSPQLAKIY